MTYCIYCGDPYEPGERFCGSCGRLIEVEYEPEEEYEPSLLWQSGHEEEYDPTSYLPDGYERGVYPSSNQQDGSRGDDYPSSSRSYGYEGKAHHPTSHQEPSKGENTVLVAIALVLTVALLAFVGYFFVVPLLVDDEPTSSSSFVGENGEELTSEERVYEETLDEMELDRDTEDDAEATITDQIFDINELNRVISARTEPRNVAVAVLDLNTGAIYYTENANRQFVAAGFYAPVYAVVREYYENNTSLINRANDMMGRSVNQIGQMNDDANYIIRNIGDLAGINRRLDSMGFTATHFGRFFGTTGGQNYTSATEAVQLLERVYQTGGFRRMSFNLGADGVSLPSNATFNAHRGSGVGDAYNVFAVVEAQTGNYAVVILTDHMGQDRAILVVSDVLREVHRQMGLINE